MHYYNVYTSAISGKNPQIEQIEATISVQQLKQTYLKLLTLFVNFMHNILTSKCDKWKLKYYSVTKYILFQLDQLL